MNGLYECLPKVTNEVGIINCIMKSSQLNQLVKHSYKCQRLRIAYAIINDDQPYDFKIDTDYTTNFISFIGTGSPDRSDWKKNKDQFEAILKAIAESGLKDSLTEINIHDCQITTGEAQVLVNDLGMNHIKVSDVLICLQG